MADVHTFQEILDILGYRTMSYSGRGMFGKQCLAIATDKTIVRTIAELAEIAIKESIDIDLIKNVKIDSLSLGTVIYFPDTPFNHDLVSDSDDIGD